VVTVLFSISYFKTWKKGEEEKNKSKNPSGHKGDLDLRKKCTFSWLSSEKFIQNLSQTLHPLRLTVPY